MKKKIETKGQFSTKYNVEYSLRDKFGNAKPLFQQNTLYTFLINREILTPFSYLKSSVLAFFLGSWSSKMRIANAVMNGGFALIAGRINGYGSPAAATYIAVGTGTSNPTDPTQVALATELATDGLSRANGTTSLVTTTVTNDTAQVVVSFSVLGAHAVTESGLFNASSGVTMLCRQVFSAIGVDNEDSLQITWKIKAS